MKCFTGFVEADDWTTLVVWFVVEIENLLHVVDEVSVVLWRDLPVVREMRFEGFFCSIEDGGQRRDSVNSTVATR